MIKYELSETSEGVILFSVHIRLNFTVEANWYLVFRQALGHTWRTAMCVIYRIASAVMVYAGAKGCTVLGGNDIFCFSHFDHHPFLCNEYM